jgi:hypothetical protein
MDRAMKLHPRWVIEALYSGNDLYDAYAMVYTRNQVGDLRSTNEAVLRAIEESEQEGPLAVSLERLFRTMSGTEADSNPLRRIVSKYSMLWGMLRATKRVVAKDFAADPSPDSQWTQILSRARISGGFSIPFERGTTRTVLVPQYRLAGLNMEDPRIREGLRLSMEAIRRMAMAARNGGSRFAVVLVPTKDLVFFETFGPNSDGALSGVVELAREERKMWTQAKNELRSNGIDYVDVLPALCESLKTGNSPYPMDVDGHPNTLGNRAIANAVWHALAAAEGS